MTKSQFHINNNLQAGSELKTDFLKEYKGELLKYRDLPKIKELLKEIEGTLSRFKKSDEDILERFKELTRIYQKEHHFSEEEMNLRPVAEYVLWLSFLYFSVPFSQRPWGTLLHPLQVLFLL